MEQTNSAAQTNNFESENSNQFNPFESILKSKEISKWSRLIRRLFSFKTIWDDIFQTIVTISIAALVIFVLIYAKNTDLIDKSTFGVMFGTVIGYVLSWRFGK